RPSTNHVRACFSLCVICILSSFPLQLYCSLRDLHSFPTRRSSDLTARLVEHIHEVGVFKDVFHLAAAQKVFDILRDARGNAKDLDRKSTRLNSSHVSISYAVFCLKKKNNGYPAVILIKHCCC